MRAYKLFVLTRTIAPRPSACCVCRSLPAHYGRYSSLRFFDGTDPHDMAESALYRRAEVPFVIRRPLQLDAAVSRWSDDEYIARKKPAWQAEANSNKHFMFVLLACSSLIFHV